MRATRSNLPNPTRSPRCRSSRCPTACCLPGGLLPLHVFEPRYRELTRDCLAGQQLMARRAAAPRLRADLLRPPAGLRTLRRRPHHLLRGAARWPVRAAAPRRRAASRSRASCPPSARTAWSRRARSPMRRRSGTTRTTTIAG